MKQFPKTHRVCQFLLLTSSLLIAGCSGGDDEGPSGSSSEPKRIVILTNGPDPFWDTCEAGAKRAEEELGLAGLGYEVDFQRANFSDQSQIDKLKEYALADDIAAVGISVFNPNSLTIADEMRELRESGVHVITIDGDVDREQFRDARYAYLGTDNIVGGRELGRAAAALNPDAKYAFFVGSTSAANAVERMRGFGEGIGSTAEELERLEDGGKDRGKARSNVESVLARHDNVDMLVGIWAYNTPQIVNVVTAEDIRDRMHVACFDAAAESITGLADGNVDVMVVQNPYQMGFEGVRLMLAMAQDDKTVMNEMLPEYAQEGTQDIYRTELRVVVPEGETPITRELFEEETQFFTLPKFQEWLTERGLTSS